MEIDHVGEAIQHPSPSIFASGSLSHLAKKSNDTDRVDKKKPTFTETKISKSNECNPNCAIKSASSYTTLFEFVPARSGIAKA